jgi:TonB family protein
MFIAIVSAVSLAAPAIPINRPVWFSENDYPAAARSKGAQGSVRYELIVDAAGKPTSCSIQKSSGGSVLDEATCRIIVKRARFKPASDSTGKHVPSTVSSTVAWTLPGGRSSSPSIVW